MAVLHILVQCECGTMLRVDSGPGPGKHPALEANMVVKVKPCDSCMDREVRHLFTLRELQGADGG